MHGNVYEIELLKDYGYGYVQTLLTSELGLDAHLLIRTLDYYSKFKYDKSVDEFSNVDDLVYPSLSLVLPTTRGANKWRLIGNLPIPKSYKVPKFKADFTTKSWECKDWDSLEWFVITNLNANGLDKGYRYNQVKHLPFWKHCTPATFKVKLTMFWLKKYGLDVKSYFDIESNYANGVMYNEVINSVFYSELDSNFRNIPFSNV
jgi:hypothetical protein